MVHDAGPAAGRLDAQRARFPDGCAAVVFGHSPHPAARDRADGAFQIFNPGSPTDRRGQPRHTMGEATVADGAVSVHDDHARSVGGPPSADCHELVHKVSGFDNLPPCRQGGSCPRLRKGRRRTCPRAGASIASSSRSRIPRVLTPCTSPTTSASTDRRLRPAAPRVRRGSLRGRRVARTGDACRPSPASRAAGR